MAISKIKSESIDLTDTGYTFGDLLVSGDLTIDTSSLTVDSANNRVGIGTTTPNSVLHITNSSPLITLEDSDVSLTSTISGNSGNVYLNTATSNRDVIIQGSGTEVARITGDGFVGIGTSNPVYDLHIADTTPIIALQDTDTNTVFNLNASSTSGIIQYQTDVTSIGTNPEHWFRAQGRLLAKIHDNADFSWYEDTGSSVKMFWDASAEELGIGTTTPGATLHISSINPQIRLTDTDNSEVDHFINGSGSALVLSADENNELASSTMRFHVDGSEKMRIDDSGRVGIGASNNFAYDVNAQTFLLASSGNTGMTIRSAGETPFAMIHFADGTTNLDERRAGRIVYQHSTNTLSLHTANSERIRIDSSGNVGIGTTSPDRRLHLHNTGTEVNVRTKFSNASSGEGASDGFEIGINGSNPPDAVLVNYESSPMAFFTNATERMRINSSGNVGIGETSPLGKLHIKTADVSLSPSVNADELVIEGTGNVGITIGANGGGTSNIFFGDTGDNNVGEIQYNHSTDHLAFNVNASEAMRIDSSGNLLVGTTQQGAYGSPGIVLRPIGTHGVTNSFSTAWSIPNDVSGLLFVQGGASGRYGGVSLFMLNKTSGFNATITQISGFAGDVAGYTSSWQLSGSNAFQLKHNIPNQTINYNLKFIAM